MTGGAPGRPEGLDRGLRSGISWNLASFAVMGASGVLLNVVIGLVYEPWVLGVFTQTFALYGLASQAAVFGIHQSVLRHVPIESGSPAQAGGIVTTALVLAAATGLVVSAMFWLGRHAAGGLLGSSRIVDSLECVAPGLLLFSLNKVLLAALNGFRRMRAFALANAARAVLILAAVLLGAAAGWPGERLAAAFTLAEALLLLGVLAAVGPALRPVGWPTLAAWGWRHLGFGARGVGGGLLVVLNGRIDVLLLSLSADDRVVGIYSLGATFAEGMMQLMMVLRFSYDPLLARLAAERRWQALAGLIASGRRLGWGIMLVLGPLAIAGFPVVLAVATNRPDYAASWPVFAILVAGTMLGAGYLPFTGLLQQSGYPGWQSAAYALATGVNVAGNLLLVPRLGMLGAATATAVSTLTLAALVAGFGRRLTAGRGPDRP